MRPRCQSSTPHVAVVDLPPLLVVQGLASHLPARTAAALLSTASVNDQHRLLNNDSSMSRRPWLVVGNMTPHFRVNHV